MKKWLLNILSFYQRWVSPLMLPRCRFFPTCSSYAIQAIQIHGVATGTQLALKRICRCHPWGRHGLDTVPDHKRLDKDE